MKTILQKISAFSLALLVLFSTSSFVVDQHFCGKFLVDSAVFSKAESCGVHFHEQSSSQKEDLRDLCCNQKKIIVDGQDELQSSIAKHELFQQVFLVVSPSLWVHIFKEQTRQAVPFKNYSPPLLVYDIPTLNQVFLI
ncbi:hypothetical protein [Zunongwangia sp. H14]|uniref:HYC_CC_PP family protein n=1 Tax=Zunongwangia sp. H14 TaxID=3240792 RepID=UPI003567218B